MLWVDFDDFLADPATGVVEILRTVGAEPIATRDIEALLASPLMRRYSKSPEHAYDAKLRAEVLAAADRQHGAEVRRGMEWLRGMGLRHAMAARALEASGPGRQASPGLPPL